MKSDKELLEELVEYFDNVMVDVEEGKPFEKMDVPDYRGHELEFRIDIVIELFQDMMSTYSAMRNFLMRTDDKGENPFLIGDNMCCTNIKKALEEYEKEYKKTK